VSESVKPAARQDRPVHFLNCTLIGYESLKETSEQEVENKIVTETRTVSFLNARDQD
jgi:hypothetical protein